MSSAAGVASTSADVRWSGRTPMAHLLHALNQPLTGLQCSLELAVAGPRSTEQYMKILRDALELTGRMRMLVAAMREIEELQRPLRNKESIALGEIFANAVEELLPVAQTKRIRLLPEARDVLFVTGERGFMNAIAFRLLDATISDMCEGGELRIILAREGELALVRFEREQSGTGKKDINDFSGPALLIAQAAWEQAGAQWTLSQTGTRHSCTIGLPLANSESSQRHDFES